MKIFIICSKAFYNRVPSVLKDLEAKGHKVVLPNSYDDPAAEEKHLKLGAKEHAHWKAQMLKRSREIIDNNDAVLVLNFDKSGVQNYIGGATFLEMYDAFNLRRKIFLFNEMPEGALRDEIASFSPIVINGDLSKVR